MAKALEIQPPNMLLMGHGVIQVRHAATILVVEQVPEKHVIASFRRNQHGGKPLYEDLPTETIYPLSSSQACHYIKWDLKASTKVCPSGNGISLNDHWIHEDAVPTLAVGGIARLLDIDREFDLADDIRDMRRRISLGSMRCQRVGTDNAYKWRAVDWSCFFRSPECSAQPRKLFPSLRDRRCNPGDLCKEVWPNSPCGKCCAIR